MLSAAMFSVAIAADNPLVDEPVALNLHPVHTSFVGDWQSRTRDLMGGRQASPLFRSSASAMDVYWRLAANDIDRPLLLPQQEQQAIDLAWLGGGLGLTESLNAIIQQTPELARLHQLVRSVTAPSVEVQAHDQGVRVSLNGGMNNARVEAANLNESVRLFSPPRIRLSSGLTVIQIDTAEEEDTFDPIRPGLSMMLALDRIGPVSLRARSALVQMPDNEVTVDWFATGRLNLTPRLTALGNISGDEMITRTMATGLEWRLVAKNRTAFVRLMASQRLTNGDERVMVTYNQPLRWRVPSDIKRWPLGQEPDAFDPPPVFIRDTGPNQLVSLVPMPEAADVLVQDEAR
ncbi:MAG: hypothetical protein AAFV53_01605 [Myxococcota bacterium]